MQNLMELDYGWATLDDQFIFKIVQILSSPSSLINVCRPATAILKKLVEADPASTPGSVTANANRMTPLPLDGNIYRYGFHAVFEQMRKEHGLLETVVGRLGSQDTAMALHRFVVNINSQPCALKFLTERSMMLINSLLSHVTEDRWEEFVSELDRLNVRKAVVVSQKRSLKTEVFLSTITAHYVVTHH